MGPKSQGGSGKKAPALTKKELYEEDQRKNFEAEPKKGKEYYKALKNKTANESEKSSKQNQSTPDKRVNNGSIRDSKPGGAEDRNSNYQKVFGNWTGKTPVNLLNEFCQKNKWNKPEYIIRGNNTKGFICTIMMQHYIEKAEKTVEVRFTPITTTLVENGQGKLTKLEEDESSLYTTTPLEARNLAATYALFRMRSTTNLRLMLPHTFKIYWNSLENFKKYEFDLKGAKSVEYKYSEDPFKAKLERDAFFEAKKNSDEKKRANTRTEDTSSDGKDKVEKSLIDKMSDKDKERWEKLVQVEMGQNTREYIENIVVEWKTKWEGLDDALDRFIEANEGADVESKHSSSPGSRSASNLNIYAMARKQVLGRVEQLKTQNEYVGIAKELTTMGFKESHVYEAMVAENVGLKQMDFDLNIPISEQIKLRLVAWLCIHMPEADLPQQFLSSRYKTGTAIHAGGTKSKEKLSQDYAARRISQCGIPLSVCQREVKRAWDSIFTEKCEGTTASNIELAKLGVDVSGEPISRESLVGHIEAIALTSIIRDFLGIKVAVEDVYESVGEDADGKTLLKDELEAFVTTIADHSEETVDIKVEGYCGDGNVEANCIKIKLKIPLLKDEGGEEIEVNIWSTNKDAMYYPHISPIAIVCSEEIPNYIKVYLTRKLNEWMQERVGEGYPIIFEAIQMAPELIEEWMNEKPLLIECTKGLRKLTFTTHDAGHDGVEDVSTEAKPGENLVSEIISSLEKSRDKVQRKRRGYGARTSGGQARNKGENTKAGGELKELPVHSYQKDINQKVIGNQALIVEGATGSGKTTQIPQFILELFRNSRADLFEKKIICIQPRRISAISVATRVVEEINIKNPNKDMEDVGDTVGYMVRGESRVSEATKLIFATTGVLLRMIGEDPKLNEFSCVIVDEVHERSIEIDLIVAWLKRMMVRSVTNQSVHCPKIILMSATIDTELLQKYFSVQSSRASVLPPIIKIPGRTFPVTSVFVDDLVKQYGVSFVTSASGKPFYEDTVKDPAEADGPADSNLESDTGSNFGLSKWTKKHMIKSANYCGAIDYNLVAKIIVEVIDAKNPKDLAILVFMPGLLEIKQCLEAITQYISKGSLCSIDEFVLVGLHSTQTFVSGETRPSGQQGSQQQQQYVFSRPPPGKRKVIVSTNIAETSVTIEDIGFVIDAGRVKIIKPKLSDENNRNSSSITQLVTSWSSQASIKQRKGRAGRVRSGICYHLYSNSFFSDYLDAENTPEINRLPLEQAALTVKSWLQRTGITTKDFFNSTISPPSKKAIYEAEQALYLIGATVHIHGKLNILGQHMAGLPVHPRLAKMIMMGCLFGCLESILVVASYLSTESPFVMTSSSNGDFSSRDAFNDLKTKWADGSQSDFMAVINVYKHWKDTIGASSHGNTRFYYSRESKRFCVENCLSLSKLIEIDNFVNNTLKPLSLIKQFLSLEKATLSSTTSATSSISGTGANASARLINSVVFGALFPNLAMIRMPKSSYSSHITGTVLLENEAKDVKFYQLTYPTDDANNDTKHTSESKQIKSATTTPSTLIPDRANVFQYRPKLFSNTGSRLFLNIQSALFKCNDGFVSNFLTYFEARSASQGPPQKPGSNQRPLNKTNNFPSKIFLRDVATVPIYSLLLLTGPALTIDYNYNLIVLGNSTNQNTNSMVVLKAWPRIGVLVYELKNLLNTFLKLFYLKLKFKSPSNNASDELATYYSNSHPIIHAFVRLIETDGKV